MRRFLRYIFPALVLVSVAACEEPAPPPPPVPLDRMAMGHYCGMIVADHEGPKAQIHLKDHARPLWFTSVRDAVAYQRMPEGGPAITAFYVHDMARATSWAAPGDHSWAPADQMVYVIGSGRRGGMGALEAVPFSDPVIARKFIEDHGGKQVALADIPDNYVLGTGEEENGFW